MMTVLPVVPQGCKYGTADSVLCSALLGGVFGVRRSLSVHQKILQFNVTMQVNNMTTLIVS